MLLFPVTAKLLDENFNITFTVDTIGGLIVALLGIHGFLLPLADIDELLTVTIFLRNSMYHFFWLLRYFSSLYIL